MLQLCSFRKCVAKAMLISMAGASALAIDPGVSGSSVVAVGLGYAILVALLGEYD